MVGAMPKFYNTEWFVGEEDNWHLKEGAPADLVEEMREFRKENYSDENVYGKPELKKSITDQIDELLESLR